MKKSAYAVALSVALCGSVASAQRTYVVDALGGLGVDYTDLEPALLAAQAGDRFLVYPGARPYWFSRTLTVSVPIELIGRERGGAFPSIRGFGLALSGVPRGRRTLMSGFSSNVLISVVRSSGIVILDRLIQSGVGGAVDSGNVWIVNSDLQTSGDLLVRNSNVVIANCRIRPGVARNGVFCQTGTLAVVGSDIVGSSFGGTCPFSLPAGNAVTIADGLGAAGYVGGGNTLRGGTSFNPCAPDGLPIDAGAFAFVDTVYSRYAHPNRPAEEMCTITPQAAEAGTTTRVDYLAPSNQSVIVAASFSLSPTPVRLPGDYPDLYLDAGSMFPIAALTPSGRRGSFGVAIPANVPPGTIAWLQAASVSANGDLRTSPCVPLVVD